jgi:hypothetical protein
LEAEGRTTTAVAAFGGGRVPRHGVQGGRSGRKKWMS